MTRRAVSSEADPVDQNTIRRRGLGLRGIDRAQVQQGFTLFSPIAGAGEVLLIDLDGRVAHRWDLPCPPGRHAKLLANGNLFYQGKLPEGATLYPPVARGGTTPPRGLRGRSHAGPRPTPS